MSEKDTVIKDDEGTIKEEIAEATESVSAMASDAVESAGEAVSSLMEDADEVLDKVAGGSPSDGESDVAGDDGASGGEGAAPTADSVPDTSHQPVAETYGAVADAGAQSGVTAFIKMPIAIGIAIACAIGGGAIGYFAGKPHIPSMSEKTTLTTDELDTVVGQVTFNGKTVDITAKQVIMLNGSLTGDEHDYPSADEVISTARNIVLEADAEERGIKVDEKAMKEFMTEMLGSDDYEGIADQYQIDVESLKTLVKSSYISQEVRKQVVGDKEPSLAAPPTTPAEGQEEIATEEYFSYIVEAAGDEWDAEQGVWADEKGDFAITLGSSKTFDPKEKKATYDDALGAYQVLGSRYSAEASSYDTIWNDYLKKLLSGSRVSVYSLLS